MLGLVTFLSTHGCWYSTSAYYYYYCHNLPQLMVITHKAVKLICWINFQNTLGKPFYTIWISSPGSDLADKGWLSSSLSYWSSVASSLNYIVLFNIWREGVGNQQHLNLRGLCLQLAPVPSTIGRNQTSQPGLFPHHPRWRCYNTAPAPELEWKV